ncbi:MAG TPA: hypothetical protein VGL56_04110 [Fimbriimonadaceae bacterium]|jgi:hypothetical protein
MKPLTAVDQTFIDQVAAQPPEARKAYIAKNIKTAQGLIMRNGTVGQKLNELLGIKGK